MLRAGLLLDECCGLARVLGVGQVRLQHLVAPFADVVAVMADDEGLGGGDLTDCLAVVGVTEDYHWEWLAVVVEEGGREDGRRSGDR